MTLLGLLSSCSKPPETPRAISPCPAPHWPAPLAISPLKCGESVCLSVDDTKALAKWMHDATEYQRALRGCIFVEVQ